MANQERVLHSIELLQKVKAMNLAFDMSTWQESSDSIKDIYQDNTKAVIECGSACCYAGWLAVSDEFKAAGGTIDEESGAPEYMNETGAHAVAKWLDIEPYYAAQITAYGSINAYEEDYGEDICHEEITPDMVIAQLEKLLVND